MKIFTAWDSGRNAYDRERLTSLEVAIWDGNKIQNAWDGENCSLKSFGWVNGVWDVRGEEMRRYIFPVAGILEGKGDSGEKGPGGKEKRKRDGEEENGGRKRR
jgi:hypothetical protein